jgi:hypothetical protein
MVAQNGPSVQMTKTVHPVRAATAKFGLRERAPITRKTAAVDSAISGRLRRPHVAPSRMTAKSEKTPPSGIANVVAIQGSAAKLAAWRTSKHQVQVKPENEDVAEISLKEVAGKQEPETRGAQRRGGKRERTHCRDSVGVSTSG